MAHFAKVVNNKVTQVIVAEQEFIDSFVDSSPGQWIQTSYNTIGNKHTLGGKPLRGNYAGVGFSYDANNDVFIPQPPFKSWVLNLSTWLWQAPIPCPEDGKQYLWDESYLSWTEVIADV